MKLLRDKKQLTRFLILYQSAVYRPTRLADIAHELEMTEQGVHNYISEMESQGLIEVSTRGYNPTHEGMELVREVLSELMDFLEDASKKIDLIADCTAIALDDISKGDQVGLFMDNGFLHASHESSHSTGTALTDAKKGGPVKVGALKGIIDMEVGMVYIQIISESHRPEEIKQKYQKIDYDRLAVIGELEYGIATSSGLKPDIIFSPIESTINAVERGLNVLLLINEDRLETVIERIRQQNRTREGDYRIQHKIIGLSE